MKDRLDDKQMVKEDLNKIPHCQLREILGIDNKSKQVSERIKTKRKSAFPPHLQNFYNECIQESIKLQKEIKLQDMLLGVAEHGTLYGKNENMTSEIKKSEENSIKKGSNPVNENKISPEYKQFQQQAMNMYFDQEDKINEEMRAEWDAAGGQINKSKIKVKDGGGEKKRGLAMGKEKKAPPGHLEFSDKVQLQKCID